MLDPRLYFKCEHLCPVCMTRCAKNPVHDQSSDEVAKFCWCHECQSFFSPITQETIDKILEL